MRRRDIESLNELLSRLRTTNSSVERNELAIKAAETGSPNVSNVLIELIDRPELANERGTLVHCLGNFDCSKNFPWLVNLVVHGNWEVSHEAMDILAKIDNVEAGHAKQGYDFLLSATNSIIDDEWRADLIADLLSMFG